MEWLALNNVYFLVIIPIILLFYLLKRKYENQEISSVLLWNKMLRDLEANRPWQKLKRNLLLFLQLLIAFLIIVALLKPAIHTEGAIANHTVIVIDTSGSMMTIEKEGYSRIQLAKDKVKKVISHLGSNQKVTLIQMDNVPRVLISKGSDQKALIKALNSIDATPINGDALAAFSLARSIASADQESGIMWYSDGSNQSDLSKEILPTEITFSHIIIGEMKENISIGTFITEKEEDHSFGIIRLDNHGLQTKEVNLSIYDINHQLIDSYSLEVDGNGSQSIELEKLPLKEVYQAVIDVNNDGLNIDNVLSSIPFEAGDVKAFLTSDEGNHFILQGLKAAKVNQIDQTDQLPTKDNSHANLYVYDGIAPPDVPKANSLIFAPSESTNWLSMNGEIEMNSTINIIDTTHPILKHVDLGQVHVSHLTSIDKIPGLETIAESNGIPVVMAGEINNNRVVLVNFNLHQSDFPLTTTFPIFIRNVVEWLSPQISLPIGIAIPGERISIPFTTGINKKELITPNNEKVSIEMTGTINSIELPKETGLYKVNEYQNNNKNTRFFVAKMDDEETVIAPASIHIAKTVDQVNEESKEKTSKGLKELAPWFILLALLIAFIEWVVYTRGY